MRSSDDADYLNEYRRFLDKDLAKFVQDMSALIDQSGARARYFFAGNGASAAIASHLANDFSKALGLRATTFHDPAFLTCFANDYGYPHWLEKTIELFGDAGDVVVLISSSGRSENIVNAAEAAAQKKMKVVLLCGPRPDPKIEAISQVVLKVQSDLYNIIECCHMIGLCAVVDRRNPARLSR